MSNDILIKTLDDLRTHKCSLTRQLGYLKSYILICEKSLQEIDTLINLVEREIENNLKQ